LTAHVPVTIGISTRRRGYLTLTGIWSYTYNDGTARMASPLKKVASIYSPGREAWPRQARLGGLCVVGGPDKGHFSFHRLRVDLGPWALSGAHRPWLPGSISGLGFNRLISGVSMFRPGDGWVVLLPLQYASLIGRYDTRLLSGVRRGPGLTRRCLWTVLQLRLVYPVHGHVGTV